MKIKQKIITLVVILMAVNSANAQSNNNILSLDECYKLAKENYPLNSQYDLLEKSKEYSLENASKGYLPQFSIGSQATYQSDVTQIPIHLPNMDIPTVSNDQYKVFGDVSMPITGLFTVKHQKDFVKNQFQINKQQLDVEMYQLKKRINQLYFGILLIDAQLEHTKTVIETLNSGIAQNTTAIVNGVALKSSADILQAELIKVQQRKIELESNRKQFTDMLSLFIHQNIDGNTVLQEPVSLQAERTINRPELNLFSYQQQKIETKKQLVKDKVLPHFNLFFQGGYGKPGLNMLSNEFDDYYIGGIRLSWNITSFYTQKNEKRILTLKQSKIKSEKETFIFNTNLSLQQTDNEIDKLTQLLEKDKKLVALRKKISQSAQNKLKYGTITTNDYLKYILDEDKATQEMILHQIQLLKTKYETKIITGN